MSQKNLELVRSIFAACAALALTTAAARAQRATMVADPLTLHRPALGSNARDHPGAAGILAAPTISHRAA